MFMKSDLTWKNPTSYYNSSSDIQKILKNQDNQMRRKEMFYLMMHSTHFI